MIKAKKNILIYSLIGLFVAIAIACVCCIKFIKFDNPTITIICDDSLSLSVGDVHVLDLKCSDEDATFKFTTDENEVIKVEGKEITALSSGVAYVKIEASHNNVTGRKNVKVIVEGDDNDETPEVDLGVVLDKEVTLYLIDKMTNKASIDGFKDSVYYSTNEKVSLTTSNSTVVSISKAYKKISAIGEGSVTITFYSTLDPSIKSVHTIRVLTIPPVFNLLTEEEITLDVGESANFNYDISPVYYTGKAEVTTSFSNENIVGLENGVITAINSGSIIMSVYLNNEKVKEINIVVNEVYIPSYSIKVEAFKNCTLGGKTIYTNKDSFTLKISVVNDKDEVITTDISITGATYSIVLGKYFFEVSENVSITIESKEYDISETYNIILN